MTEPRAAEAGRTPLPGEGKPADLRSLALKGVLWSTAQSWGARVTTTAVFVVLARLLDPSDFGLVALASLLVGFFSIFAEQGFGQALVQRRELDQSHLDSAFWSGLGVGVAFAALSQLLAGPLAVLLHEPRLAPVLRWLALNFVIAGVKGAPSALLRRQLRFKALAARSLVATACGGVVGVAAAVAGFGVWALVGQNLTQGVIAAGMLWGSSRYRPGVAVSRSHVGQLYRFGLNVLGADVLHYVNRHADDFLIGVFLGPVALGYYTVAYRVLLLLTDLFTRTIGSVALPAFSQVQDDLRRLRQGLYTAIRFASLTAFPAFLGVAAVAPELTQVVFGSQWSSAVPVMRVLALVGALHAVVLFNDSVVTAIGRPGINLVLALLSAICNVAAFATVLALGGGVVGVAAAYVVVGYALTPLQLLVLRRLIALDVHLCLRQLAPVALSSAVMAAVVLVITRTTDPALDDPARLALGAVSGVAAYLLLLRLLARELWELALGHALVALGRNG